MDSENKKLKNIDTEGSESDIKTDKGKTANNKGGEIVTNEGGGENQSGDKGVSINKSPESKMTDTREREKESIT